MTVGELKQMLRDEPDGKMVLFIYTDEEWVTYCPELFASGCGVNLTFCSDLSTSVRSREVMCCKMLPKVSGCMAVTIPALPAPESTGLAVIDSRGHPGAIIRR
jgi:hypothetical protein